MKYNLYDGSRQKAYMQLYLEVRKDIIRGIYGYGQKLPSKRQLADRTGVSVITVEHAYDLLIEEGYIEPKERSGYFVIYRKNDAYSVAPFIQKKIISRQKKKKKTEEDLFPFSVFAKAVRAV
ncbi:MAG: GntR family transcriptional regulator, partial [Dialister sp.]|nr:GntR family transcriptional regulator [Dialister sp.]